MKKKLFIGCLSLAFLTAGLANGDLLSDYYGSVSEQLRIGEGDQKNKRTVMQTISLKDTTSLLTGDADTDKMPAQARRLFGIIKNGEEKILVDNDSIVTLINSVRKFVDNKDTQPQWKALGHGCLARLYSQVLDTQMGKISNRTPIEGQPESDNINEWSAKRFYQAIYENLVESTSPASALEKVKLSQVKPFIMPESDNKEASLYGVLLRNQVNIIDGVLCGCYFQSSVEYYYKQSNIRSSQFQVPVDEFLKLKIAQQPCDFAALDLNAYQQLISLAGRNNNSLTMAYWDLQRIDKVFSDDESDGKTALLKRSLQIYKGKPGEGLIAASYCSSLPGDNAEQLSSKHKICNQYMFKYTDKEAACLLLQIKQSLEAQRVNASVKDIVDKGDKISVALGYTNIKKLRMELQNQDKKVVWEKDIQLRDTLTFVQVDTTIVIPGQPYGAYQLSVTNPDARENKVVKCDLVVSSIFLAAMRMPDGAIDMLVVDRASGKPIQGATVKCFEEEYKSRVSIGEFTTNANGIARFNPNKTNCTISCEAVNGKDEFLPSTGVYLYRNYNSSNSEIERVSMFTDRAVYAPGQTIHFKGICWSANTDETKAVTGKEIKVYLKGNSPNNIAETTLTTDQYGGFSGEFVIPATSMSGIYNISTSQGVAVVTVADYQVPNFRIEINKPKDAYSYNKVIPITGNVKTFSGVNLPGARVDYSVVQQPNLIGGKGMPVSSGSVLTDATGNYSFSFLANESKSKLDRNSYGRYSINVKVTSPTGETQESSAFIGIGKEPGFLVINGLNQRNMVACYGSQPCLYSEQLNDIEVDAFNYSNEPISANGTISIYRYKGKYDESTKSWSDSVLVTSSTIKTNEVIKLAGVKFPAGEYLVRADVNIGGTTLSSTQKCLVFSLKNKKLPMDMPNLFVRKTDTCQVGSNATIYLGSTLKKVDVLYQVFSDKNEVEIGRFTISNEIKEMSFPYKKEYGDVMTVCFTYIKDGVLYTNTGMFMKAKPDKKLSFKTETFRDKLQPGTKEEWKFRIMDASGHPVKAQVLAELYDAAIDKIVPSYWMFNPGFNPNVFYPRWQTANHWNSMASGYWIPGEPVFCNEFTFPELNINFAGFGNNRARPYLNLRTNAAKTIEEHEDAGVESGIANGMVSKAEGGSSNSFDVRSDFSQTAFFYPMLQTQKDGSVVVSFTVPESLTQWNFRALANTADMMWGMTEMKVITYKPFMLSINMPEYVRQGDSISISSLLMNTTNSGQNGEIICEMFKPSNDSILLRQTMPFSIAKGESKAYSFPIVVPSNTDVVGIRIKGGNESFSDGEQQLLAVLPSRTMVTNSMTMNVAGAQTSKFTFADFVKNSSTTAENYRYTVEFTGNPAWYAVQALPGLSNSDNKNASNAIASYFVNTLAAHIVASKPEVAKAIEEWNADKSNKSVLQSKLQMNQDLKQLFLSETPWVLDATNETQSMQALATLLDKNRLVKAQQESYDVLKSLQASDGGFSWYPGMTPSLYQTLEILMQFARLTELNAVEYNADIRQMQISALDYVDAQISKMYSEKAKAKANIPGFNEIYWLMVRGFYSDVPFNHNTLEISKKYNDYIRINWRKGGLLEKAIYAQIFDKYGFSKELALLITNLRQLSKSTPEMGMYWPNNKSSYFNKVSGLRCHVLLMQAFIMAKAPESEINNMKLWLLKQKQTQQWGSVPMTLEAIYGILVNGNNWLESSNLPVVKVGGYELAASKYFAYADTAFTGAQITPGLGEIEVVQKENHPAYGAAYWQYFDNFDAIKQSGKELKIEKSLYKQVQGATGVELVPLGDDLKTGDIVTTRIVLTADRDFEFVTVKDQRAACFEPTAPLAQYRYNENVGYYFEPKTATTNMFFSFLPKGTYVFEYTLKTVQKGDFHDGISSIKSLYAPEFVGNTQCGEVKVK